MNSRISILCLIALLWTLPIQLFAQNKVKTQNTVKTLKPFNAPAGFKLIPGGKNGSSFYVMEEPVKSKDYREFVNYLSNNLEIIAANKCRSAIFGKWEHLDYYIVLTDSSAIPMYAQYMSKLLSDSNYTVQCSLVNDKAWKQMKGPEDGSATITRNPYGIKFMAGILEWKNNKKGDAYVKEDVNHIHRGVFRLMMTVTPKL